MVETLTLWAAVLTLLVLVLGAALLYVWLGTARRGDCRNCGGSGQTVVQGTNGNVTVRCRYCGG